MSEYIGSGSAIERGFLCAPSLILPHPHFESEYTARGSAIHAFLEACTTVGRDAALEQVPFEWRDACEELNLEGLHAQLSLAAEVSIAYDVETDTARELGRGEGRKYDDVRETEIPCTLDVIGVRDVPDGRRGLYVEWKSGFTTRRPIDAVLQINFGALAISRCYGCDFVEGQLVHVHEDIEPWVQRTMFEAWELDAFASELREHHARWRKLREQWRANVAIPAKEFRVGPWCDQCSARQYCDAQARLVRSVLSRDEFDGLLRVDPIPDEMLAQAWADVHVAQSALSMIKSKILGIASTRNVYLGKTEDGKDRWLGSVVAEGNEKLDGESVFDVVAELHGEEAAAKATRVVATKDDLDSAVRNAVPRGKKAAALREIYSRLRTMPGAITKKITVSTKEFTTRAIEQTERRELSPGMAPEEPGESARDTSSLPGEASNET